MPNQKKPSKIDVKLGSEDMAFWQEIIEARKIDIANTEKNLKYYKFILENAEKEFKKAEEEFNKSS